MGNPRLLVAYTLGVALVVGVILSLATNSWWLLAVAIGVHFGASAFFLGLTGRALAQEDKPDPVTEAHLDAQGKEPSDGLTDSGRRDDREVIL